MSTPFLCELRIVSFPFAPKGWAQANGQFLPIAQNQAMFALLGTTYGGNGQTTFALPDLRSRVPIHMGDGNTQGQQLGQEAVTITTQTMPQHIHPMNANTSTAATANVGTPAAGFSLGQTVGSPPTGSTFEVSLYQNNLSGFAALAPQCVGSVGGNQPHENRQPFLTLCVCIALQGIFPSQN